MLRQLTHYGLLLLLIIIIINIIIITDNSCNFNVQFMKYKMTRADKLRQSLKCLTAFKHILMLQILLFLLSQLAEILLNSTD